MPAGRAEGALGRRRRRSDPAGADRRRLSAGGGGVRPRCGGPPRRGRLQPRGERRPRAGLDGQRRRHGAAGGGAGSAGGGRPRQGSPPGHLQRRGLWAWGDGAAARVRCDRAGDALRREQGGVRAGGAGGVASHRAAGRHRSAIHPHGARPGDPVRAARLRGADAGGEGHGRARREERQPRPDPGSARRARRGGGVSAAAAPRRARRDLQRGAGRGIFGAGAVRPAGGADRGRGCSRSRSRLWPARATSRTLSGDSTKLRRATGWAPTRTLEQTLRGLVDAEAD